MIGVLWIGEQVEMFHVSAFLLTVGFAVNTLSAPAYFMNVGEGELRWNVWSHALLAFLTAALGFTLGDSFGAIGVVVAAVAALVSSSLVTVLAYHWRNGLPLSVFVPDGMRGFFVGMISVLAVGGALGFSLENTSVMLLKSAALCGLGMAIIILCVLLSPMRMEMVNLLRRSSMRQHG
jgi:hypothetical protein